MSWFNDVLQPVLGFAQANPGMIVLIVFTLGFAESIALVSLFVPSTFLFLGIGGIHSAAGGQFLPVWLAGSFGAAAGDVVSYLLGRYFRDDAQRMWPFSRMPGLLPKARAFVERWGFWSIVIGKFIGGLRPFVPVVAGIMDMPWLLFVLASLASAFLWAGIFLAPGYGIMLVGS
jgi:membrane protein DedA with SNARE-associated domain